MRPAGRPYPIFAPPGPRAIAVVSRANPVRRAAAVCAFVMLPSPYAARALRAQRPQRGNRNAYVRNLAAESSGFWVCGVAARFSEVVRNPVQYLGIVGVKGGFCLVWIQ
jgi:hypothetical protein